MADFVVAVEDVQGVMAEHVEGNSAYLLSPDRRAEAGIVDPCATRFVAGEMDATGGLTIGRGYRIGSLGAPPSLAEKLGNKLIGSGSQTLDRVRLAVNKGLAVGYLSIIEVEGRGGVSLRPERTAEAIWEFWMSVCRDMLEDAGIPKQWATTVRGMGADVVVGDLKSLGLTRFLGGSKLNQLGMKYAQLGAFLRMAQTDDIGDELFQQAVAIRRDMPDRPWKLDEE